MKTSKEYADEITTIFRKSLVVGQKIPIEELIVEALESTKAEILNPSPCVYHKDYKGQRQPRTICRGCWEFYIRSKLCQNT